MMKTNIIYIYVKLKLACNPSHVTSSLEIQYAAASTSFVI